MNQKVVFTLIAVSSIIIFLLPLFKPGAMAGHDAGYHYTRIQLFTNALKEGQFPVRWIEGPVPGLSHPLFLFYPSLFYYATAIFMFIGLSYVHAAYVTLAIAAMLAWVGMYVLVFRFMSDMNELDRLLRPYVAAFSAILFLFTPYRISQLYVRAAYGEFLATSMIPWVFFAFHHFYNRYANYKNIMILVISLSAMFLGHQPTAMMVAFPLFLWIIFQSKLWKNSNARLWLSLSIVGLTTTGLLAWFLLPLVSEKNFIRSQNLTNSYYDFRQHFVLVKQLIYMPWGYGVSVRGPNDGMSFQVGIVNWVVIAGIIVLFLYHTYKHHDHNQYSVFFFIIFLYSLFMSIDLSEPIWERFSVIQFAQYPWRFLGIASFATAVLGGIVLSYIFQYVHKNRQYLFFFLFLPILFNLKYLAPAAYLSDTTFDLGNPALAQYTSPENPLFGVELAYLPLWVQEVDSSPTNPRFQIKSGDATISPILDTITRQIFKISAKTPATVRVNTHYFPGWMATVVTRDTANQTVIPGYNNSFGNMEITVEPGEHTVTLAFTKTPIRQLADGISFVIALGLVVLSISTFWLKRFWSKNKGATSVALRYHKKASLNVPRRRK